MCASLAMTKNGFWQTLDVLVGSEWRRTTREVTDDVEDWVDKVIARREKFGDIDVEKEAGDENFDGSKSKRLEKSFSICDEWKDSYKQEFFKALKSLKLDFRYVREKVFAFLILHFEILPYALFCIFKPQILSS